MNYTHWMLEKFPALKEESSSTTFEYIAKAKSQTKVSRFALSFMIIAAIVFLANYLLSFYDIPAFESASGWLIYSMAILSGIIIAEKTGQILIRQKLSDIIESS